MKQAFNKIKSLVLRELGIIAGDHSILLTVLVAPLLYALFLGSIYTYKEANQITLGIVDMDKTPTTRMLIRLIESSPQVNLIGELDSYEKAIDKIYKMEVQAFLYFPANFEKELYKLNQADVKLFINTTRFLPSNELNKAIQKILITAGAGVRLKYYEAQGLTPKYAMRVVMPLQADIHPVYNPTNNYGDFLLPGLFLLILQQTLLLGFGESVARENEKKTYSELTKLAGNNLFNLFAGKAGFYFILYIAYVIFFLSVIFPAFDLPVRGSLSALSVLSLLFLLSVLFYSFFIASFFNNQIRIMEVIAFTTYPIFLVSGYSWPITAMPVVLQWVSYTIPTTPFFASFIKINMMGAGWEHITPYLINLIILTVMSGFALYLRLRYLRDNLQ